MKLFKRNFMSKIENNINTAGERVPIRIAVN